MKELPSGGAWVEGKRPITGDIFKDDPATRLKELGTATLEKLANGGIMIVGDLSLLREVCLVLTDAVNCKLFWCNTKHDQAFVLCALGARA